MFRPLRSLLSRKKPAPTSAPVSGSTPAATPAPAHSGSGEKGGSFLSNTFWLVVGLAVAVVIGAGIARFLHHYSYKKQIIIHDFLLSGPSGSADSQHSGEPKSTSKSESAPAPSADFGKEVSDFLAADLNDIIQQGSGLAGSSYHAGRSRTDQLDSWVSQPFDGIPRIPVSKSYGIEIQGISVDQIINTWNSLRFDQHVISGDLVPAPGARYVLQVSLRSDRGFGHWASDAFLPSEPELSVAIQALAERLVIDNNPEIAGRFYLANHQYSRAVPVFLRWLTWDPGAPEPNLYLAKSLVLEGEYDRALQFAQDALDSASRETPRNRLRLQLDAQLAKATALWGAGSATQAEAIFAGPLNQQADAQSNLGVLYLGEAIHQPARYQDAERVLKLAIRLDPQNFGAEMSLGQTYAAEGKQPQAAAAYRSAAQLKPDSPQAADAYLDALHKTHDDPLITYFCHTWVGTKPAADQLLTDPTHDLYVLCAQAENELKSNKNSALALYYSEALLRPISDGVQGQLFSDQVDIMPQVLCPPPGAPPLTSGSDAAAARIGEATVKLTLLLRNRAKAGDKNASAALSGCEKLAAKKQ